MSKKSFIPNPETRKRLVTNLRQTRLELEDFGLQLEELLAGIEKEIREQKLKRLEKNLRQPVGSPPGTQPNKIFI